MKCACCVCIHVGRERCEVCRCLWGKDVWVCRAWGCGVGYRGWCLGVGVCGVSVGCGECGVSSVWWMGCGSGV